LKRNHYPFSRLLFRNFVICVVVIILLSASTAGVLAEENKWNEDFPLVDGDARLDDLFTRDIETGFDITQRTIYMDFDISILGQKEDVDRVVFSFYEPEITKREEDPSKEDVESEIVFSQSFLEDNEGGLHVDVEEVRNDFVHFEIRDLSSSDEFEYDEPAWRLIGDSWQLDEREMGLTHNELISQAEDDEVVKTPMEIHVKYESGSEWENATFGDTNSHSPFVISFGELTEPSVPDRYAFLEEVKVVANFITATATGLGALSLIFLAYKWMNPALDNEEKKKIKEDAYRWIVGLGIIFSARLIAAVIEYIGTGEVVIWSIL